MTGEILFTTVSWLATVGCAAVILYTARVRRGWLLRPAVAVVGLHTLFVQVPFAVGSGELYHFFPSPWLAWLATHGFTVIALLGVFLLPNQHWHTIWQRVRWRPPSERGVQRALVITGFIVGFLTLAYLYQVPLTETGLFIMLTDPVRYAIAREESLKLLTNPLLRYGFSLNISVFTGLFAGLLAYWYSLNPSRGRLLLFGTGTLVMMLIVSLPGARGPAVELFLVPVIVLWLQRQAELSLKDVVIGWLAVLGLPAVFTVLRQGLELSPDVVVVYALTFVFERIFVSPAEVGSWYIHYAQTGGEVGVAGIPRLASLLGEDAINLPNIVGLAYTDTTVASVNANAGFIFAFYAYFGPIGTLLSLVGVWLLDATGLLLVRLSEAWLIPTLAVMLVASLSFIASDYTPTLLTHGFLSVVVAALLLDRTVARVRWR